MDGNLTKGIKNIDSLPENAKKYIYAVEDFIGAKISSISTSPEREDTILLENPFDLQFAGKRFFDLAAFNMCF